MNSSIKKLIVAAIFVQIAGISCRSVMVDETTGSLLGVVSDKATGEPVSGVGLILSPGGNSSETGSDGVFSFTNLPAREYTISFENCGWIVKVDPDSGELIYGKTGTVIVTIDRELLSPGLNETVLVVRTSGQGGSELIVRAIGVEKRKPSLNVLEPTECKASSVMLNAEITDSGIPAYTERGFVYSESPMPDVSNAIAKISASVTEDIKFSAKLQSLIIGWDGPWLLHLVGLRT